MKDYLNTVPKVALFLFLFAVGLHVLVFIVWCFVDFSIEPITNYYNDVTNASAKDYRVTGIVFVGLSFFFTLFKYVD